MGRKRHHQDGAGDAGAGDGADDASFAAAAASSGGFPGAAPAGGMMPGMMLGAFPGQGGAAAAMAAAQAGDLSKVPAAFRKQAVAGAPGGGLDAMGFSAAALASNPLLALTAGSNPMLAMMMAGGMANAGGIAGNLAMPKPVQQKPPEPAADSSPDPDIVELFDHFHIDPRHLSRFQGLMEKRQDTFAGDMLKLWELLEHARSPEGMLVSKMREMETGTFIGKTVPDDVLLDLSKKFRLDQEAESKLSDVLAKYDKERRREYMKDLERHLETSSRPSAMVMMCLKKLGEGLPLGRPGPPAPGCYLDRQRRERDERGRPRDKDYRPRSPGARRSRSRGRRSRSRSRSRSRGGGHDKDRRGGGGGGYDRDRDRERGARRASAAAPPPSP